MTDSVKKAAMAKAEAILAAPRAPAPVREQDAWPLRVPLLEFKSDRQRPQGRWALSKGFLPNTCDDSPSRLDVRVGTMNIWFDTKGDPKRRWTAAFNLMFSPDAAVDVVALQETTQPSLALLKSRPDVQRDWLIVDGETVLTLSKSWYGSTMAVKRSWLSRHSIDKVDAHVLLFGSVMRRCLVGLEFSTPEGIVFRIGTAHFESGPNDQKVRKRQFYASARVMSLPRTFSATEQTPPLFPATVDDFISAATASSLPSRGIPPSIICGDTNIESYDELEPLLNLSYIDTFDRAHPIDNADERYTTFPTFFTTYKNVPPLTGLREKRLDYVLARGGDANVVVEAAKRIGQDPIFEDDGVTPARDDQGTDGRMYPSDHLGVVVDLVFDLGHRTEAATVRL